MQFLKQDHYDVVGTVEDGAALVRGVMKLAPNVALVDISMPGMNGVDAIALLTAMKCETKIVVLTAHRGSEFVQAAFAAGALGYVVKHRLVTDLPPAIEQALRGERFLSPTLTQPTE